MPNKPWLVHYPDHIAKEIDIPKQSIPEILQKTARDWPHQTAISFYQQDISYQQLERSMDRFATGLQQNGIQKGDRVAMMLPNSPQFVMAYYGILRMGGIVTQVNPMLVERELEYILKDSEAKMIVVWDQLYPLVKKIQPRTQVDIVVVVSLQKHGDNDCPEVTFDDFLASDKERFSEVTIHPAEDLASLQYTGGTTGRSKGVMLTHRNLVANVVQTYEFFKDTISIGHDRFLTVIPLFHVFGMTSGMNMAVYTAATNILLPRFDLGEVLETIKNEQPTTFPGVPTMYVAIANHPDAEAYGIGSIRFCNSGSAPMPVELMKTFENRSGAEIFEGYGLSEAAPTTHCNPRFAKRKPGSVGIGLPSTDYKIVDYSDGIKEMPPGEPGELIIRGPQVMKGYWRNPEETKNTLKKGWLYTGDIATMDEEGYVSIVDRKKDLIIAGGYNIYPREVEEVLYQHPDVQEAVVVGIPDKYRGETVKAVVVLKDGSSFVEKDMLAYCRKYLAAYKAPKSIECRDVLPKTSVGKILRRQIVKEEKEKGKQTM
ncbi:long-chain-fatty-acid--CoA ligase [Tuberibacillus sp. Marseille-P3662]|uniref:long-chain-fatty-acid--CoA ligase n=1 Tax=Tuberibacillus sp. Marseille-P3662 TaxID=1965358 RepID=UPI000A1CAC8A|nr:long-chain fatty acid--CoA ligase [Tuberibacillus sp. Marseille-P3662]